MKRTLISWFHSYLDLKKKKKNKQKQIHRYKEQISSYQRGRGLRAGKNGWRGSTMVTAGNQTCVDDLSSAVSPDVEL